MTKYTIAVFSLIISLALNSNTYSQQSALVDLKAQGIKSYHDGDYKSAAQAFQSYVKQIKDDPDGWYYLGLAKHRMAKRKDAKKAFNKSLSLSPHNANFLAAIAYIEFLSGEISSASLKSERALALDSKNVDALYILGYIQLLNGKGSEAKSYVTQLLSFNDKHAPGWLLLSNILVDQYRSEPMPAHLLEKIKATHPLSEEVKQERALYLKKKRGYFKEAADALELYLKYSDDSKSKDFWTEQLETLRVHGGSSNEKAEDQVISSTSEVDSRPQILYKEKAKYSEVARANGVQGAVILRCVFHKDGVLKHILVLKGLPLGLTEQAVYAAKQVKFIPAVKNGQPVSIVMSVEYNFNLY